MINTLSHIIENAASKFPNKEAFRFMNTSLTYEALNTKSTQLAKQLVEYGIQKGDRVGIYMNRCLETTIAVYGILKAGAVYIPLDPFIPVKNVIFMIDDCEMKYLVSTPLQNRKIKLITKKAKSLKNIFGISLAIEIPTISWNQIYSTPLNGYKSLPILKEDLAFLLYTSGSTGAPKAVMHTHRSGLALAYLAATTYNFGPNDRIGIFSPLYFDPSTFGYFSAPLVFATAIIISDAHLRLPASLAGLVSQEKISIWYSVPMVLIQLLLSGAIKQHDFSALRWVMFAGEAFVIKHLRALMKIWPHAKFSNLYGPAEVIICTYHHLDKPLIDNTPIPIGKTWGDNECKIIDTEDKSVENGKIGQLVVKTTTMMKGYWRNKELTDKSFYKEHDADGIEHIFYRTGDLVLQNKDGLYMFHGRNDRQVKVKGYRLELDEIEITLLKYDEVQEVAVVVLDNDTGVKEIVAVVRKTNFANIEAQNLVSFCKIHLPAYSLPETIKFIDDFPRTSSGKINRVEITRMLKEKEI